MELLFNFGTTLSADEQLLANDMRTCWANLVRTGDPNLPRFVPLWAPFNAVSRPWFGTGGAASLLHLPPGAFLRNLVAGRHPPKRSDSRSPSSNHLVIGETPRAWRAFSAPHASA